MDKDLRKIIDKNGLTFKRITIKSNVRIIDTQDGIFAIKKKGNRDINETYRYLKSRAFDYFPEKIDENDKYEIYEYIEEIKQPYEQKAIDMMYVLSLLHSKTTFYKEVDFDYYKEIYENVNNQIEYLYNYYNDIITLIEKEIYMSPSSYLFARNITKVYVTLQFCKENIEKWYEKVKDNKKMRVATIHNNVCIDHLLKRDKPYLISWNQNKIDMPIYDLLCFYKKHYLDFDFTELFHLYESRYILLEEERILLFVLIALPEKLEFNDTQYNMCIKSSRFFDYLYKSEKLITTYSKSKH